MRRPSIAAAAMAAALSLMAHPGCGASDKEGPRAGEPQHAAGESAQLAPGEEPGEEMALYFPDEQGRLEKEWREMIPEEAPALRARQLVQALIDGPRGELTRSLPPDVTLRALHLGTDGTAYVDLDAAFARSLSDGSEDALLAVRSLVETLGANMPEVRRVKILVEGEEPRALGGHLDLSRPLAPEGGE